MLMKTSELSTSALDWAVDTCEAKAHPRGLRKLFTNRGGQWSRTARLMPSSSWQMGGPIIERERITLRVSTMPGLDWAAFYDVPGEYHAHIRQKGPTALIAAMRCFVNKHLGDEVDIPEELLK